MDSIKLQAHPRDLKTTSPQQLRREGLVPAVIYGNYANTAVYVDHKELAKTLATAGESSLVDLEIVGQGQTKILIHDVSRDPQTSQFLHVDLLAVRLDEKLETEIEIVLIGESAAIKDLGGNLTTPKTSVRVEALPQDLVAELTLDISSLLELESKLTVGDLVMPKGITVLDEADEALVIITSPRTEAELEAELAPTTSEAEAAAVAQTEAASKPVESEDKE